MATTQRALRFLLLLFAASVLAACGDAGTDTDTDTDTDSLATTDTPGTTSGDKRGSRANSAAADTAFRAIDEELGAFDLDIDGDGDFDAHLEAFAAKIEALSEPDRTQATKDYNPAPGENEFVQVDTDAQPLNLDVVHAAIRYPEAAKQAGKEGTVRLKVLVDMDGWYGGHVLRGSPDPRLTNAVLEQVKKIRYKPATKGGKPVKVWVNFAHTFKLPKQ